MKDKKFLVIILISSHICYLQRAIDSVLEQKETNIKPDIYVNVNTLNETFLQQVKNLIKNYNNIKIISSESNGKPGMGHNKNIEIFKKYTEYDYLLMLDGDDLYYPYAFHQFEKCFEKEPNLDLLHLMINDKITYINDPEKPNIPIFGNFKNYTYIAESKNWWQEDFTNLDNPMIIPLYKCRTPSRILLMSRKIFESKIPIVYCNNSRLFDDFSAFLGICENEFNGYLNSFVLSNLYIYCYNANNDESVTFNFTPSHYEKEQSFFDNYKINYPYICNDWNFYKKMKYIHLSDPKNFNVHKKLEYCIENVVKFEIKDYYKHASEFYNIQDYEKCLYYLLKIEKSGSIDPDFFKFLAKIYFKLKNYKKSLNYYKKSLQILKNDDEILRNIGLNYFKLKKYRSSFIYFVKIKEKNNLDKQLINDLKTKLQNPLIILKQNKKKQVLEKPILCIYTGFHTGKFNGSDYKHQQGVYGSEISAIHLAEQMTNDYRVFIFCNVSEEKLVNNVMYMNFNKFNAFEDSYKIDILIISRFINFFHLFHTTAKKKYLWLHDAIPHDFAIDKVYKFRGNYFYKNLLPFLDGIICVSNWQKEYMFQITDIQNYYDHEHKFFVIGNGFNPNFFKSDIKKIPNKFIYCSNPDRGLDILLDCFPLIQEKIPDASLDIYFGEISNELLTKIKQLKNVKFHGRIEEDILIEKLQEADVFFYPNQSHETFCINALMALRAGCVVVCRRYSGIAEVVSNYGHSISGNIDENWKKSAINFITEILSDKNKNIKKQIQEQAISGNLNKTWENSAKQWIELFKKI